ncbi:SusD/RagB family nutrient-binding outer membrane lipoprotein [Polaribacter sp. ALD11]|uniref:SusD/RagB family nutrient-binding outer membrane lipoprotein n=1 Tax=Polaribacter sp. ALD11 TaxID=2058137 RepID=UPI000C315D67|nr:SusD/RagB family nutrient-binding outer membrane lipoprotein [Polaribacter sp. ALD11]AUC83797.1 SusD/RagB family nutrient-binding outer membrane lipoprotein [Polaribacter sp. ALD11]
MKNKFIYLLILFFSLTSCEEYLDVNENIDAPAKVDGYLYLAGVTQQYQELFYDLRAIAPMTQMMGTSSYSNFASHYYNPGSDSGGQIWRMTYWSQGQNLENLINQSKAAEDWTLAGIGLAMKAFSWDLLTKVHGEVPMKDAFVPDLLQHDYDYQKEVYAQVREWAYEAVELLERADDQSYGNKISDNDFIYGGDKDKWIKFSYAIIVRNLASLTNKTDFSSTYAQELITAAGKSFQSPSDDATVKIGGGSQSSPYSSYNNFWGTARRNLSYSYFQHEYAVQVFTGTVPEYELGTGDKIIGGNNPYHPYELATKQIITDTLVNQLGHFDPRVAVKLATTSNPTYEDLDNNDSIKAYKYYGGSFTGTTGSIGQAPSYYGRTLSSQYSGTVNDGSGRWVYRDDAPYILTTYAEIKFCLAEAYWKLNQKPEAFNAFKEGIRADMQTTARYISTGNEGSATGGDKITTGAFNDLSYEYLNGPFVNGLTDFTLSHIMMQKWVALYPWGAQEAWVDMRKYNYDIAFAGDAPSNGDGFIQASLNQKIDSDPSKIYKGLYLAPAQVQGRKGAYNIRNEGSPSYRLRPRFNSEYMWNLPSLEKLKPISGTADNYHTSIPWFVYPGELPE